MSACLPTLGDFGFFDVQVEQAVVRSARAFNDPDTESLLLPTQWVKQEHADMILCALSTGHHAVHNDIDDEWYRKVATNEEHLALLRRLAFRAMLTVPMRFRNELIGSLTLFMGRSGRSYSNDDVEFAEELAALAAPLIANVRLLEKQRQAEADLRKSEERLRLATEAGNLGIWEWDMLANRLTWSDAVYALHGVPHGQFGGTLEEFSRLVYPPDLERVWEVINAAIQSQDRFSVALRALTPEGNIRHLFCWGHITRDDDGKAIGIVGATQDITAQKRAEGRLLLLDELSQTTRNALSAKAIMEASTRLLGQHLGATRCAYADVEPDNDRFTIRGDWSEEGIGSSVGVYSIDQFGPVVAAATRQGGTLVIRDVNKELSPEEGADLFNAMGINAIISCPLVRGGKLIAMMAVHQDRPRLWRDDEIGVVEQVVERSWAHIERVRATELLHRREAHLSSLIEQTAAGICEVDLSGKILQANDRYCQILQREHDEVIGRTMQEFTHPDDLPRNLEMFGKAIEDGMPFEIEKRYLRPDGTAVWVNNTVSFIRGVTDDTPDTILAIVLDVSARKHAEEELHKANQRKDEFLAMLAHELRNPLAPISAAADILTVSSRDPQRVITTSAVIKRQVRHMTSLVDDLLDVSRVTRGLVQLELVPLDAKTIVSDALEQVRPLIEEKRHHLAIDLTAEAAHVTGDQKRLVQVMTNLLNNAAKYTPSGGNIHLRMEIEENHVALRVTDDGIGIEKELQPYIFELFSQAKRSADRSQGGLGIGLALVKSLVELHGGMVTCHSDGVGKGSCFSVCLPRLTGGGKAKVMASDTAISKKADRPLRVLVVDDNADAAAMLAMLVETLGHETYVEHSSSKALETAASLQPDVCLLDIGLPDMDGNELARRLRSSPQTANSVLVAITGYGQEKDRQSAFDAGFSHHFAKPVDTAELAEVLRKSEQG